MFASLTGIEVVYLFLSILIGVTLHEMMHGYVAFKLGDTTAADMGRLTLNPLASIDPIYTVLMPLVFIVVTGWPFFAAKPVPFNPARVKWDEYGAALVGLAGPATNFGLALIGGLLIRLTHGAGGPNGFLAFFTFVNVGLMVFNLIPFPPLDGSRVLYAVAPEPLQDLMVTIERLGFVAILIFVLLVFETGIGNGIANIDQSIFNFLVG